jgi:DNA-binding GntR family transcriptional regulator
MPIPSAVLARNSPIPLYHQFAQHLRVAIEAGLLVPGERLPNEIALAESFDMSRPTMRQALGELVSEGLLVRQRGVGTMVAPDEIRRHVELTSLLEDLEASGRRASTRVLTLSTGPGPEAAVAALQTSRDQELLFIERVRYADGKPLALMRNWLLSTDTERANLTADALERCGLYRLLRESGRRPAAAHQYIGARAAGQREARHLEVKRGSPLITVRRTAYDGDQRVVEYGEHLYRSDDYTIEVFVRSP